MSKTHALYMLCDDLEAWARKGDSRERGYMYTYS